MELTSSPGKVNTKRFIRKYMMNNKFLLSICIPTYNRPAELDRLLLSIANQDCNDVEIVIGDDGDFFATKQVLEKYRNLNIVHFKNENGPGFDTNLLAVTKMAIGKYVWWMGDDDEMNAGAVVHVLNIIKNNSDVSFLWVNHYIFDQNIPAFLKKDDYFFQNRDAILEEIANLLGFISSIIFKKESISNVNNENLRNFIGLKFINLYLVLHTLSGSGRFFYVNNTYVCVHPTPVGEASYDGFTIFAINFYDIVNNFKGKFNKKSIKKMLAKNFGHVWRGMFVGYVRGYDNPRKIFFTLFSRYWNYSEFWIAGFVFLFPRWLDVILYKIYKKFVRHSYGQQ